MSEDGSLGLVGQLLEEELEAVTVGLEQGIYSCEEMDLPHDTEGSTALISACRRGLTTVMHFLLEKGADATLCNHSNQTALHVSQPSLQRELLMALIGDVPHQRQLPLAAWRGDHRSLQDLMAQTDSVDLNKRNKDGLTPLMLAVRDVDLFEGLEMPWTYQPVEVVKELVSLQVDVNISDGRGHTALWYASQIKSAKKEELLQIMESLTKTETIFTWVDVSCWPVSDVPDICSSTRDCTIVSDGMKRELTEIAKQNNADIQQVIEHLDVSAENRTGIEGCMEPKTYIGHGREVKKPSSRTSSLPSIWDNRTDRGKARPLHPSLSLTSCSLPALPAAEISPVSRSAPVLMEPLLDATVLLQARTNIHNRLRSVDLGDDKKMIPTLCSRSPKHLAPLDNRDRDSTARSSLQHPLLLKEIAIFPIPSKSSQRLERVSRQSFRRSRSTRADSEESNCSSSSQEEGEGLPKYKHKIHEGLRKSLNLELETYFDFQDCSVIKVITDDENNVISENKGAITANETFSVRVDKATTRSYPSKTNVNSKEHERKSSTLDICSLSEEHESIVKEIQPEVRGPCFLADDSHLTTGDVNVAEETVGEKKKPVKLAKGNERKVKMSIQTNQSFNVLAHRTTKKRINSPNHLKLQQKPSSPITVGQNSNKYLPRAPSTACRKNADEGPTARRVSENCQHKRSSDNKKVSNQNQIPRGVRSARTSKNLTTGAPQRARSAVDYVTYNDMFLKISQGDEGPEIYEMFATPIYENLRVDSSAERTRQVHAALQVKRQTNGKLKVQKTLDVNRRKPVQSERSSRAKCRHLKRRDNITKGLKKHLQGPPIENKCSVVLTSAHKISQQKKSEIPTIEGDGKKTSILSLIEEVLSSSVRTSSFIKDIMHQEKYSKTPRDAGAECETADSKVPDKPFINTWTSEETVQPVYQRFLDEVGDGPLTDDLLRSLAEELISLERRDVETPKTEEEDGSEFKHSLPSIFKQDFHEGASSDELPLTTGFTLDEAITWTKGEVLGRGAYGTVYCGLTSQGQLIAVKQVILDISTAEMAEKEYNRLEREVDLLKNLHHTNIVGFLGTALCENTVSIFMEYVPGGSISNILSQFGPLPEKVFTLYTQQILEGVAYLHANRVIHRDLKGNNIMLMSTGVVKLIDFGCARRLSCLQTSSGSKSDLFKSVHGTPYWMAPEVINETGHGRKSDIWSIGCTVFEMATGKPPLAHMNKMAALFYIGARKGLMPSLSDDFSSHAKHFVEACLTREPRQRPSAEELLKHPFIFHHSQSFKLRT